MEMNRGATNQVGTPSSRARRKPCLQSMGAAPVLAISWWEKKVRQG
jgi:hypothetical protein